MRSGRDRRSGRERRGADRRRRTVAVLTERRMAQRRHGHDRRSGQDRRRAWVEGRPVIGTRASGASDTRLSARDRTRARMLPDEFVAAHGDTPTRLARLVRRLWSPTPRQVRVGLVEGLTPILDPLRAGAPVTEAVRDACETVVTAWLGSFRRS